MSEQKTNIYPYRPPKKFTEKSLHGRTRFYIISYKDLRRFMTFYMNVFGWDMIELPAPVSGIKPGDEHPTLFVATGPTQYDFEALLPGHMHFYAIYAPGEKLEKLGSVIEIHMDRPLEQTIQQIVDHGGRLVLDKRESVLAKPLDDSKQSWQIHAVIEDPAGNYLYLWKCPSSRTWKELEAEYDVE